MTLKLLMFAFRIDPSDARFLKLRRSFESAGISVEAAAPVLAGQPLADGVKGLDAGPRPPGRLGAWLWNRRLKQALNQAGDRVTPDVIYVFDPEALPAALRLKSRSGAALIYDAHEFHEDEDPSAPERGRWVKRTELAASTAIDTLVTVNASIAGLYRSERPDMPTALIVHNAVDPASEPAEPGRLRAALGLKGDAKILLYHGALAPMRGLDLLVRAAPLLAPDWTVVLMGKGPLAEALRFAADPARVKFLPPVPHADLRHWISDATLGAILYEDTGRNQHFCSPNKLWELAASGIPMLATDLPELRRLAGDRGAALMIAPESTPANLAAQLNALSSEALASYSDAARGIARTQTWSSEVAPLIERIHALGAARIRRA